MDLSAGSASALVGMEEEALQDDLISVDADAMSKGIDVYGKIALYGIFFDHDHGE